jgi:hypothetical protein
LRETRSQNASGCWRRISVELSWIILAHINTIRWVGSRCTFPSFVLLLKLCRYINFVFIFLCIIILHAYIFIDEMKISRRMQLPKHELIMSKAVHKQLELWSREQGTLYPCMICRLAVNTKLNCTIAEKYWLVSYIRTCLPFIISNLTTFRSSVQNLSSGLLRLKWNVIWIICWIIWFYTKKINCSRLWMCELLEMTLMVQD